MENDFVSNDDLKIDYMVDQNVYIRNSSLLSRIFSKLGHSSRKKRHIGKHKKLY